MNKITTAAIKADASLPSDRKEAALQFLRGQTDSLLPRFLVSQAEAARALSVSRLTIWRLVRDGILHPVCIRGARRYRVEELQVVARG
jgi:hypothetical protein